MKFFNDSASNLLASGYACSYNAPSPLSYGSVVFFPQATIAWLISSRSQTKAPGDGRERFLQMLFFAQLPPFWADGAAFNDVPGLRQFEQPAIDAHLVPVSQSGDVLAPEKPEFIKSVRAANQSDRLQGIRRRRQRHI
jgi:hypothetical protein